MHANVWFTINKLFEFEFEKGGSIVVPSGVNQSCPLEGVIQNVSDEPK